MPRSGHSIVVHGIFVFVVGVSFLIARDFSFAMTGFEASAEHWIDVIAVLLIGLGYYYVAVARSGNQEVHRASAIFRLIVAVGLVALVAFGRGPIPLLAFAAFDVATATWTLLSLDKK